MAITGPVLSIGVCSVRKKGREENEEKGEGDEKGRRKVERRGGEERVDKVPQKKEEILCRKDTVTMGWARMALEQTMSPFKGKEMKYLRHLSPQSLLQEKARLGCPYSLSPSCLPPGVHCHHR